MMSTELLAIAHKNPCEGPLHCFYCGAPCDKTNPAKSQVKNTFTSHPQTYAARCAKPQAEWFVCAGCMVAMRSDTPVPGYDKPQRWWTFSHIVTAERDEWLTKANLSRLIDACISPPAQCAIVLADSGQKHQLYLAPINTGGDVVRVILETEPISYRPAELLSRMDLCRRVAVAAGKPSLEDPASIHLGIALSGYWSDWETILESWTTAHGQPLTRLAAWLTPGKETLGKDNRYVSNITASTTANVRRTRVPAKAGGADGPQRFIGSPGLFG